MTEGIFALLGVAVGGLIVAGTTYWMERKREDRGVQAAARHGFIDLYASSVKISDALDQGNVEPLTEIGIRLADYLEHEPSFAVHLRIRDYLAVSAAVGQLRLFIEEAETQRCSALSERERRRLKFLREQTVTASDILLDVARCGPAHMWAQRVFRKAHRGLRREKNTVRKIRQQVEDLMRMPTGLQPDSGDDDGPEGRSSHDPRST